MQGDDRFARAGSARDLGDAACGGPDRLVLMGLDGRDDVAHPAAPGPGERRHQGAVADDDEVVRHLWDHEVVLDADDRGPLAAQDPTSQHTHRLDGCRPIER